MVYLLDFLLRARMPRRLCDEPCTKHFVGTPGVMPISFYSRDAITWFFVTLSIPPVVQEQPIGLSPVTDDSLAR